MEKLFGHPVFGMAGLATAGTSLIETMTPVLQFGALVLGIVFVSLNIAVKYKELRGKK